ncbi:MAG: ROK family protein [Pirellulales bacterium]|nr:ROK family protein [Pirellulales bacterium]
MARSSKSVYLGVDVGGTKIQAALVEASGRVIQRRKCRTPREGGTEPVLEAIQKTIAEVLARDSRPDPEKTPPVALGLAIPGVVDPDKGLVVVAPNMNLVNAKIGPMLEKKLDMPVALGNDANLGILGEKWLGVARKAVSALGIFVGTGIGGGFIQKTQVWRGARESAGEIGHMIMQIDGPLCGCGNRGCLEALASRTAIQRAIREGLAAGRPSIVPELAGDDLSVIRSGVLRRALEAGDELVTEVIQHAAEVLGHACLTVRHLMDPEIIVLGGGVIEACSQYIMPIIERIVADDRLAGARESKGVFVSALGDDAVVLGAVALARAAVGENPFKHRNALGTGYPEIVPLRSGRHQIGDKEVRRDYLLNVAGKVKTLKTPLTGSAKEGRLAIDTSHLTRLCRGGPEIVFLGTGKATGLELHDEAAAYLLRRAIRCRLLPTDEAVKAYNKSNRRKAALIDLDLPIKEEPEKSLTG